MGTDEIAAEHFDNFFQAMTRGWTISDKGPERS